MKKIVKESLLLESPDEVVDENGKMYYVEQLPETHAIDVVMDTDTYEIKDVIISKKPNVFHGQDPITKGPLGGYKNETQIFDNDISKKTYPFDWRKIYPGRLFMGPKILTFWVYPHEDELKQIIDIIYKKRKYQLLNNGWRIEIYDEGLTKKGSKKYRNNYNRDSESYLIPIEEYIKSEEVPEELYLQHLDKKHKTPVAPGFGSRHPKYMEMRTKQMQTLGMESKKEGKKPRLFEKIK